MNVCAPMCMCACVGAFMHVHIYVLVGMLACAHMQLYRNEKCIIF